METLKLNGQRGVTYLFAHYILTPRKGLNTIMDLKWQH